MKYRWDDYCLDRDGTLLTRQGRHIDVSRKVLACIGHLIEHRQRVVGYDELIREVWGHGNASHHQLAQIVLAARRSLGDDGQTQRLIRTLPGLGYRWVGELEPDDSSLPHPATGPAKVPDTASASPIVPDAADAHPATPAATQVAADAPVSMPPTAAPAHGTTRTMWMLAALLAASALLFGATRHTAEQPTDTAGDARQDPLAALNDALQAGDFEQVRQGLATLPPWVAETPDARILDIELDLNLGRARRAWEKIEDQLMRAEATADPVLRAKLLIVKSKASARLGNPRSESLGLIESALASLESAGERAEPIVLAKALSRRGTLLLDQGRFDEAQRDMKRAIELMEREGDRRGALNVRSNLARAWMAMGRLQAALETLESIAESFRADSDRISELSTLNTITRIQMELLRWDDALSSSDRAMDVLQQAPDAERRYRTLQLRAQVLTGLGRMRLAASQLDEAEASNTERKGQLIPASHLLEAGDAEGALRIAGRALEQHRPGDPAGLLLDGGEGMLLIWMSAAQMLKDRGAAVPALPAGAGPLLDAPTTALGHIARGRWLWMQGQTREAEQTLRIALQQSRAKGHLFRSTLATEPLVGLLLLRGDIAAAEKVLRDLQAQEPRQFDGDYRFNVLRLRVALQRGDPEQIDLRLRKAKTLAGERSLPSDISRAFARSGSADTITGTYRRNSVAP
jgi:DNA-binding winged helix-turn-helix (wHTH) protein/tetratricopeptide (TPR) repeat protein